MLGLTKERRLLRDRVRAYSREIDIGHARVFVDHGFQWDGHKNVWLTRARASYAIGGGPVFDIRERSTFSQLVGFSSGVSSGDPCFDSFFTVRTQDRANTFDALTTHVRWLLASTFSDAHLKSDGSMITLMRHADFGLQRDAEIAAEVVSEIAHFGTKALKAMRGLPSANVSASEGPWHQRSTPHVVTHLDIPVTLESGCGARGPVTRAFAACGQDMIPFSATLDMQGQWSSDSLPQGLLGSNFSDAGHVGPATITCDGQHIILTWQTLITRTKRLLQGARLVSSLACGYKHRLYG